MERSSSDSKWARRGVRRFGAREIRRKLDLGRNRDEIRDHQASKVRIFSASGHCALRNSALRVMQEHRMAIKLVEPAAAATKGVSKKWREFHP